MLNRKQVRLLHALMSLVLVVLVMATPTLAAKKEKLTIWSHWADEVSKKNWVYKAVDNFKEKNPNFDVEVVWYQKTELIQAVTTSFQAGIGPDIFYIESKAIGFPPFVEGGFLADLSAYIDDRIEPWTYEFAKEGKMTYMLPVEAFTGLLYYNKDVFKKAGVSIPSSGRFDATEFKAAVKKMKDAGFIPFAAGTMDRGWCASLFLQNIMLRTMGEKKWKGIASAETSWKDPDVKEALYYVEDLIKMGAYPEGVASIKLGESHGLFFNGKSGIFPMQTFFAGRAFVPAEQGGMPDDFKLGAMEFPTFKNGKGNNLNYMKVGGSYAVSSFSKNVDKACELVAEMATPEMAELWLTSVKVQTGIKAPAGEINDWYINLMNKATEGITFLAGPIELQMDPDYRDVVYNTTTAFVAGKISADRLAEECEKARLKVK